MSNMETAIKITFICEPEVEKDIETALERSQIPFRTEKLKTPTNAYCIYVPDAIGALSVVLDLLEAKKDVVSGVAVAAVY